MTERCKNGIKKVKKMTQAKEEGKIWDGEKNVFSLKVFKVYNNNKKHETTTTTFTTIKVSQSLHMTFCEVLKNKSNTKFMSFHGKRGEVVWRRW